MRLIRPIKTEKDQREVEDSFRNKTCLLKTGVGVFGIGSYVAISRDIDSTPTYVSLLDISFGAVIGMSFAVGRLRLFKKGKILNDRWFNEFWVSYLTVALPTLIVLSFTATPWFRAPFPTLVAGASLLFSGLTMLFFGTDVRRELEENAVSTSNETS